jgi:hypothetical protein
LSLEVQEFDEIPVLSRSEYQGVIQRGVMYTRTRRKPETTEPPRSTELREVIELAAIKRARRILKDAAAIGLQAPSARSDVEEFAQQMRKAGLL